MGEFIKGVLRNKKINKKRLKPPNEFIDFSKDHRDEILKMLIKNYKFEDGEEEDSFLAESIIEESIDPVKPPSESDIAVSERKDKLTFKSITIKKMVDQPTVTSSKSLDHKEIKFNIPAVRSKTMSKQ